MSDLYLGFNGDETTPLNFLDTRLNDLAPFSAHEIEIDGVTYKTAEHAYQALRVPPELRAAIMSSGSPMAAWRLGQQAKLQGKLLPEVYKEVLMEQIFRAKMAQHSDVKEVLLATHSRELIKTHPQDRFWGVSENGEGENRMGKLWMKLRSELE